MHVGPVHTGQAPQTCATMITMTTDSDRDLLQTVIHVFGDDEMFLPTDVITQRVMSQSIGDEPWFREWKTQRAAAMQLAECLKRQDIIAERINHARYGRRMGYYKADLMGQKRTGWWQ